MPGRNKLWPVPSIVAWALEFGPWRSRSGSADPMLADGDSLGLERYRLARAKLAEMDVLEREGQTIPRDQMHQLLVELVRVIRGAGESLQRQCGPVAHAIHEEAIDAAERIVASMFGDDDLDSSSGGTR
jgi:hypothetical protein